MDLFQNQIMHCIICHNITTLPKMLAMHTKCRKCLIVYHKFNGIMTMKKHVEYDHFALLKMFFESHVVIEAPRSPLDCEPNKKRAIDFPSNIFGFFSTNFKFKKDDLIQVGFLEDLMLFVVKGLLPMRIVESIWLQKMVYWLCP
jgi:hypothetical protein